MIKFIILDVDGVLLGLKNDFNFPFPTPKVTAYLTELQDRGVPISLCTGKPSFSVKKIIEKLRLNNLHITDGGAVIIDPLDHEIIKSSTLPVEPIREILNETLPRNAAWQLYTLEGKFVQKGKFPEKYQEDPRIMPWTESEDLIKVLDTAALTKAELVYRPEEAVYFRDLLNRYTDQVELQWTFVPIKLPDKIVILTAKNVDKRSTVAELIAHYGVSVDEVLAVGDTMMDWKFMDGCAYVATMGNADTEMQEMVKQHEGFVGGHVDADGLLDILEHYKDQIVFA